MTQFFTSDHHFGHENIIAYCNRPYANKDEMNADLVAKWNATLSASDTVHILGDLCMGKSEESIHVIRQLNGYKILYPGNHDRCWYGHGEKGLRKEQSYIDAGIDEIRQGPQSLEIGEQEVLLCHFPYEGDSKDNERFLQYRPNDEGKWLLHGHIHGKWKRNGRMINVGVDVWDYRPVAENLIAALIDETQATYAGSKELHH